MKENWESLFEWMPFLIYGNNLIPFFKKKVYQKLTCITLPCRVETVGLCGYRWGVGTTALGQLHWTRWTNEMKTVCLENMST